MTVKKIWRIVTLVGIIGLLGITLGAQSGGSTEPISNSQSLPEADESITVEKAITIDEINISLEKAYHSTLSEAQPHTPTPEESSVEVTEQPHVRAYDISYADEEFDKHLIQVMEDFSINLDLSYVYATIFCESTFRESLESSAGAVGYMQVLPSTRDYILPKIKKEFPQHSELSEDLTDPYTNVIYGLYYLRYVAKSFGDDEVNEENISKVLTCYNKGVTGGKRYFNSTGHWESEYAKKVVRIAQQIRTDGGI